MACVNWVRSSTTAILHLFSQETDLLIKVIMKCVNIKLWDILGCFHYILNPPRNYHDALETTTQDERGMNRLRVNAQIFFYVGTFIEGLFIIFIVK